MDPLQLGVGRPELANWIAVSESDSKVEVPQSAREAVRASYAVIRRTLDEGAVSYTHLTLPTIYSV